MRVRVIALMLLAAGSAAFADDARGSLAGGEAGVEPVVEFGPRVAPATSPAPSSQAAALAELAEAAMQAVHDAFETNSGPLVELGAPLRHTEKPSQAPAVVSGLTARVPKSPDLPQAPVGATALAPRDLRAASTPTTHAAAADDTHALAEPMNLPLLVCLALTAVLTVGVLVFLRRSRP